ncbi:preprotein translocase subunit SecA [Paenibacillus radicis (ex Xue et al. 2023)]|uniref:Protein translocase subunit SecA n=1 Tax=Paenibacillus radicis (ex Xue et al. 2023) TaxID=2972489 RepID=A0ABT1YRX7_9BACL|nr:preprotein translocase subunit SecA [Paenibacillus radicis (ex Xue et al. 2023)]MCR8635495.1 preprotein translocase subunit SecA [Paenibacillus radicis (ex Xue et al. 2023)]
MIGLLRDYYRKTSVDRNLSKYKPLIARINLLHRAFENNSNDELLLHTQVMQQNIANGMSLSDQLPEAYALVKEAFFRVFGYRIHDVQLMGAIVLHEGNIAEMKTGEGKTAVAVFPAYLNALSGEGVHVVTVNPYLAERDSTEMGKVFRFLGLTVGCIESNMSISQKQAQYQCDVTYATHYELGFDYLRDHMVYDMANRVQRKLNYVIIDEVDSILIDEARTPLLISDEPGKGTEYFYYIDNIVKDLTSEDYEIFEQTKQIMLTEKGVDRCEMALGLTNMMHIDNADLYNKILQSLRAHFILKKDVDYVLVKNEQAKTEAVIVDQNTGRLLFGRRFVEGLHQAIEAKERIIVMGQPATLSTITLQNYFRMYDKLSGMTGTATEVKDEFMKTYGTDVIAIPTNKPINRIDHPDQLFITEEEKFNRVVQEIIGVNARGQPVLVGTASIEKSERLSAMLLEQNIPHKVLNAKNYEEEADVIRLAGQHGAVTISTNMAGRGVDIRLGEGVEELGGLMVIGTIRHDSLRIDNQLRGRSGRQGDCGSSQFFICFEDDLLMNYYPDHLMDELLSLNTSDYSLINNPRYARGIRDAQAHVEGEMQTVRQRVMVYDQVLDLQRRIIYSMRNEMLEAADLTFKVQNMIQKTIQQKVAEFCNGTLPEDWDMIGLTMSLGTVFPYKRPLRLERLQELELDELSGMFTEQLMEYYQDKEEACAGDGLELKRQAFIYSIDRNWIHYLESVEEVKNGIELRNYAQLDPFAEFERETFQMFDKLIHSIEQDALRIIWNSMD